METYICTKNAKEQTSVTKYLTSAKALIKDPKNWCQGTTKDREGRRCALGALYKAISEDLKDLSMYEKRACCEIYDHDIGMPYVNDAIGYGHPVVMKMYDMAIFLAEETL